MDANNYLACDDLDDTFGIDPWAPEPSPAPVAPTPVTVAQRSAATVLARGRAMLEADAEFLAIVAPDLYLARGMFVSSFFVGVAGQAIVARLGRSAAECHERAGYQAVPGARNATRHSLHQTGVL